jgi:hypothetical protein
MADATDSSTLFRAPNGWFQRVIFGADSLKISSHFTASITVVFSKPPGLLE